MPDREPVSKSPNPARSAPSSGREIIVAVCGGIAAYKVADVVSKLVQLGAGVTVVMTAEAQRFVTPLTFEALSGAEGPHRARSTSSSPATPSTSASPSGPT